MKRNPMNCRILSANSNETCTPIGRPTKAIPNAASPIFICNCKSPSLGKRPPKENEYMKNEKYTFCCGKESFIIYYLFKYYLNLDLTFLLKMYLSKICKKANFPKGVINIVHGYGSKAGDALSRHPDVPIISFTGGTSTGEKIAAVAAPMFKKLSLELGGKNPNIIFADADFDYAVKMSAKAAFSNQGQICLCGSRLFVQESIYDNFKTAIIKETKKLVVGDPKNVNSNLGAVVSKEHMEKILKCIQTAKEEGGKILTGGNRLVLDGELKNGYYIEPTIIDGLSVDCQTNKEEIFGPVVSMIPFKTEEEVIIMANSTKYGLSASLFSKDVSRAHRVAAEIDSGVVWINTWMLRDLRIPFGGMKSSGVGREGGFKSLQFFTESKNVCIKI